MMSDDWRFPSEDELLDRINRARQGATTVCAVVNRRQDTLTGTFPAEAVECRRIDGTTETFWCKYGTQLVRDRHGHRGGVPYERFVYRELLTHLTVRTAQLIAASEAADIPWVILEFLPDALRLSQRPAFMPQAATLIGKLHCDAKFPKTITQAINCYSASYYSGWGHRVATYSARLQGDYPWLNLCCEGYERICPELAGTSADFIHGEYYPKNIVVSGVDVIAVDWESAAIGFGEIDLISLTDRWTDAYREACIGAYINARWDGVEPPGFRRRMALANLYVQMRWLGDRQEWTESPGRQWRFGVLRSAAEELGLL